MEAALLSSSPRLPVRQRRFSWKPSCHRRNGLAIVRKLVVNAKQCESGGESVEENWVVLRMHIKKMKAVEPINSMQSDRKEWEKEDFFEGIELLRSSLMNNRPSLALGLLALAALSVPFSASGVAANAFKVAKGLLAGCHISIDVDF